MPKGALALVAKREETLLWSYHLIDVLNDKLRHTSLPATPN
jgi:hypothetical protein